MDDQLDWADVPADHVGPLSPELADMAEVNAVAEEVKEIQEKSEVKALEKELDQDLTPSDSDSETGSCFAESESGKLIKNMTHFEYISIRKSLHNILSHLIESDEDLREFERITRENDRKFHAAKKAEAEKKKAEAEKKANLAQLPLPSISSFFKPTQAMRTESVAAVASDSGSISSMPMTEKNERLDLLSGYDPSLWFYQVGKNPIQFIPGVKEGIIIDVLYFIIMNMNYNPKKQVAHPFSNDLKKLLSKGDKEKLREVSLRNIISKIY